MAFPVAAVLAAVQAISGIVSSISQAKAAKRARQQDIDFQQAMYERQRNDALSDKNQANDFNSPASQMARLKDAGLSPMLAYGNIGQMSAPVRSADTPRPRFEPINPLSGLGDAINGGLSTYQNLTLQKAQVENLEANTVARAQDAALKNAQVNKTLADTGKVKIDTDRATLSYQLNQSLFDTYIEQAQENLRKTSTQTNIANDANARAEAMQSKNLEQAIQNIALTQSRNSLTQEQMRTEHGRQEIQTVQREEIKARIHNLGLDGEIKAKQAEFLKAGIRPGDNIYMAYIQKIMDMLGIGILGDGIKKTK